MKVGFNMFESSLKLKLRSDSELVGYLSTTQTSTGVIPSMFNRFAPEKTPMPYLVYRINTAASNNLGVMGFVAYVDLYEYNKSGVGMANTSDRIISLLDRVVLDHDSYSYIRMFFYNAFNIDEPDPKLTRYSMQFNCRAGRKKWMSE